MTQPVSTRDRLAEVLTTRPIDVDTRVRIQVAYVDAGGPGEEVDWEDLPADVQDLVEAAEQLDPAPNADPYGSHRWADPPEGMTSQGVLFARISDAAGAHEYGSVPHQEEIGTAWGESDGTWDGLPEHIRTAIVQIETFLPRTAWDDPADVPADTSYLDDIDDEDGEVDEPPVQTAGERGPYVTLEDATRAT